MNDNEYAILIFRKAFELDENIDVKQANKALDLLPESEWVMLDCLYRRGMTDQETAKLLGVMAGNIRILRNGALERFRGGLKLAARYGYWV